jgi:hypothetical protein
VKSENARSRMEASSTAKHEYGGQRKMSKVLGAFGLLDFTMLQPVLAWCTFLNSLTVYFFNFKIFSGCSKPQITETVHNESADMVHNCILISHKRHYMKLNVPRND